MAENPAPTPPASRRGFLAGLAGAGLGLATGAMAADAPPAGAPAPKPPAPAPAPPVPPAPLPPAEAVSAPVAWWSGARELTLTWAVSNQARGWVEYGPTEALGRKATGNDFGFTVSGRFVIKISLHELAPGDTVFYRVWTQPQTSKDPAKAGPLRRVKVPSAEAAEAHLAVWNDTHDREATLKRLHALTLADPPDALLWNGDVSNDIQRETDIPGLYLAPAKGLDLGALAPVLFVRGNHDVRGGAAWALPQYTGTRRPFYSFRIGPLAGIVLDTGEDKPDDHPSFGGRAAFAPLIREQAAWLAEEIRRPHLASAPYRVLFCHIPLRWKDERAPDYLADGYDHFSRRGRDAWHDSLVKWGAQLVVSGHTHQSHYLPADGAFPYAQLVGGGPNLGEARLLRFLANRERLRVRMLDIDGKPLFETALGPCA